MQVAPALQGIVTPLQWEIWQEALTSHPDRWLAEYIVTGLQEGFWFGYNYQAYKCKKSEDNLKSAKEHPQVVDDYITKECAAGRILGPFYPHMFPEVQVSRFGVIRNSEPGSWRLIFDLSYPEGRSVYDGISSKICLLLYMTVDDEARAIATMGQGTLLAMVDIKSAYRIIPVHLDDLPLLDMM